MNMVSACQLHVQCEKVTEQEITLTVTNPSSRATWRIAGVRPIWTQMGVQQVASFIVERYIHDHYSLRNHINFTGLQNAVERVLPFSNDYVEAE